MEERVAVQRLAMLQAVNEPLVNSPEQTDDADPQEGPGHKQLGVDV